jgi:putative FmdB family regulatory protein
MPIYEYECRDCRTDFELLVRASAAPTCPVLREHVAAEAAVCVRRASRWPSRSGVGAAILR